MTKGELRGSSVVQIDLPEEVRIGAVYSDKAERTVHHPDVSDGGSVRFGNAPGGGCFGPVAHPTRAAAVVAAAEIIGGGGGARYGGKVGRNGKENAEQEQR